MELVPQRQLKGKGPLLDPAGQLADIGWARQPLLDCNLENARFYRALRFRQRFRVKRWDYYAIFTPDHFFSFTLADIGYIGQVFAYVVDYEKCDYHEETLTIPLARGVSLPRNSTKGESRFQDQRVSMDFKVENRTRVLSMRWPEFHDERGLSAEVKLALPPEHESMAIVIPIRGSRFYYNRKVNCMPASGSIEYGKLKFTLDSKCCLGSLDWGRGVWEYKSFWVWASASGFLPGGRTIGLNLGYGFGDTTQATENAIILNGRIHKLGQVNFTYDSSDFKRPWRMESPDGRLSLEFTPFLERVARTDLKILSSEVHQMFGRYSGTVQTDAGETIQIKDLIGFAEEHHAKW